MSLSCGSLWFIDAGRVSFVETPISPRYLSQDDRIEIADGHARREPVKQIARGSASPIKPSTANWPGTERATGAISHGSRTTSVSAATTGQATRFAVEADYARRWPASSPSAGLRRRSAVGCGDAFLAAVTGRCAPRRSMRRSTGGMVPIDRQNLRTGRIYRRRRGRGRPQRRAQAIHVHEVDPRPAGRR